MSTFKILIDTPIGKRLQGGPRPRYLDNIIMHIKEIVMNVGCINWDQHRDY